MTRKSSTETLIAAMRVLARDIQSGDGVANAAIAEAADRLEELQADHLRDATKMAGLQARIAELERKAADGTDWKAIAMALGQRVNWAISHISERGTGLVLNTTTGESRHWKVYMAEALRMIPGVTIDDDILAAHCLPAGEKRKRFKHLAKRAEQEGSSHEQG
jgi:hypothetical protein